MGALACEAAGSLLADAACRSGDECNFPSKRAILAPLLRQIIKNDFTLAERQISQNMGGRNNLPDRQVRNRYQSMPVELQGTRSCPGALQIDVL